jgi:alkanesulfonate monooxygenase SsuD/methylene tetrahydromethanopterin reductase-like flavin-dependent oxidoreductase (luciferase family)/predicted kinase
MSDQVGGIPDPALVVLVGAAGSGKSTWARARYQPTEVVSSDDLRAVVGSGPHDLGASDDAFRVLDTIVAARLGRGLTTVVDTLGLDPARRASYRRLARTAGLPAVAVVVDVETRLAKQRNRARDRPVPASVIDTQLRRMRAVSDELADEGWDVVVQADDPVEPVAGHAVGYRAAAATQRSAPAGLEFVLQISRFRWDDDPAGWMSAVVRVAAEVGFTGIALMDHLIQIPQVGRAWEPIPEPWVTLGLLAGIDHRLRLGSLVSPVTFRSPGILAKTVATLDALSGGRAFCGLGAGWWQREHDAFGLGFPGPGERLDQLERTIETLRALWSPGTRAYAGDRVHLPETTCYPRPIDPVPIIVGGSGERRTLRIAARLADACNLPARLDTLDAKIAVLHQHCAAVGRDPSTIDVTVLDIPVVGRDRDEVATKVERLRGRTTAAAFARQHDAGTVADHVGRYRLLADRGVSTAFVSLPDLTGPDEVARFAPVVAAFR